MAAEDPSMDAALRGEVRAWLCRLILYIQIIKLNLSSNEAYYTAYSLLVILRYSCSQLHCQKGSNLIPFAYAFLETCEFGDGSGGPVHGRVAAARRGARLALPLDPRALSRLLLLTEKKLSAGLRIKLR